MFLWGLRVSLSTHYRCKKIPIDFTAFIAYIILNQLVIWPYYRSPLRHMPGPPPGDLLLGQTKALMRSETETLSEWIATYGPAIRVVGPIGLERVLFLRPEALHQTLVKDWLDYPRVCRFPWSYLQKLIYLSQPAYLRHILGLITGYGLLTVTGNDHKQMRKAINPAFAIPNIMHRKWQFAHIYI